MKMLSLDDIEKLDKQHVEKLYKENYQSSFYKLLKYTGMDINFTKAKGMHIYDENGRVYLDFLGGYGALNLGHNPDGVMEAMDKFNDTPNLLQNFPNPYGAALAHNISEIFRKRLKYCYFTNSGTETVEEAIKLALLYKKEGKILYFKGAYHGKTLGSINALGIEDKYSYGPMVDNYLEAGFGDIEEVKELCKDNIISAILIEPVQGEGGINIATIDFLKELRKLCDKQDIILIFDEIQTGMGRCGDYFLCNKYNIYPDIICISKSLGGGMMPIGCMACEEALWHETYGKLKNATLLSSTFGGNTLSLIAALATLEILEKDKLITRAETLGNYLLEALNTLKEQYPIIKDVRGQGLLIGIEFDFKIGKEIKFMEFTMSSIIEKLLNRYNIVTSFTSNNPKVLRVCPPLIVTMEQIDYFVKSLKEVLEEESTGLKVIKSSFLINFKNIIGIR